MPVTRAGLFRPQPPPLAPCYCNRGRYPQPDPGGRLWWFHIMPGCPTHYRRLDVATKVRILLREGIRV